jgi:hypothetical protein
MKHIVKSKEKVDLPNGIYAGRVGGYNLTILSQDYFGKKIELEFFSDVEEIVKELNLLRGSNFTEKTTTTKCGKCDKNSAQNEHTCPYQSDVNDDDEYTCDCCDECCQDCADDI